MITQLRSGLYKLAETRRHTKILYLDNDVYAWIVTPRIGEILVLGGRTQPTDRVLATGGFCLYEVSHEAALRDLPHLELQVGDNTWQGYLLLTGLPDRHKKRGRIIPTAEVITANPHYRNRRDIGRILAAS